MPPRWLVMLTLIIAGEAVYALPFHLARFFRPAMLEVFGFSNTQLGAALGVYGVVAMLAYFPGGLLADRYPARRLLALSLWSTAAGGVYLSTIPSYAGTMVLWGVFGATSILLFWAALIRATRDWGGNDLQGRAFGLLEAGRGVLAAVLASLGTLFFTLAFPDGYSAASFAAKKEILVNIIHGYTFVTIAAGFLAWFGLPEVMGSAKQSDVNGQVSAGGRLITVLRLPVVWLTALIVISAYVAYKGGDNYGLYAVEAWGWSPEAAAQLSTAGAWLRPVAALSIGLLGDRYRVSRMTVICFVALLLSFSLFAWLEPAPGLGWVLLTNVLLGSLAMFGLRALYFALLEEGQVPAAITGAAVGLISVLGFSPDIFVNYIGGMLLDAVPGTTGHQHFFMFLASFAALGLLASTTLLWVLKGLRPLNSSANLG